MALHLGDFNMRLMLVASFLLTSVGLIALTEPAKAASSPGLVGLERQLSNLLSVRRGEYGIAALDLRDGSTMTINGNKPFPMASTVKVAIASTYLAQVDHGRRRMNDMIRGRSAAKLMELMITRSDNIATDQLLANLGGPSAIQRWLTFNELRGIRVDRTIAQLLRERGHLADRRDVATPTAMVSLLQKLDSGDVLTDDSRAVLFELMSRCRTGSRRIRALLPAGTRVEDKTGTLDGVTNDVGFITMPDGHRVALAVFARGGRDRQPGIAKAARAIYDRFAASIPVAFASLVPAQ